MKTGNLLFWSFWVMVAIQIALPLRTVWQHESVMRNGAVYRFLTIPVDPNDPFRGKYVTLNFPALEEALPPDQLQEVARNVEYGQKVYLTVTRDEKKYVQAERITLHPPESGEDYFAAEVSHIYDPQTDSARMLLEYPFNRFYLEEFKAPAAEERYWEAVRDTTVEVYALVRLQGGIAVLEDVMIDGESITD